MDEIYEVYRLSDHNLYRYVRPLLGYFHDNGLFQTYNDTWIDVKKSKNHYYHANVAVDTALSQNKQFLQNMIASHNAVNGGLRIWLEFVNNQGKQE